MLWNIVVNFEFVCWLNEILKLLFLVLSGLNDLFRYVDGKMIGNVVLLDILELLLEIVFYWMMKMCLIELINIGILI